MIKRSVSFGLLLAALGLLSETETLDAGTVDLVYGGSLLDGTLGMLDRLRQIKGQYGEVHIQSPLYSSQDGFSFKTHHTASLYSPVFHYDGHGPIYFTKGQSNPLPGLRDLVFIDACNGFSSLNWFGGCSRVFMGWVGAVNPAYAYAWSGYFYEGLFNLYEQGHHYTIRQAYDYASFQNDLHIQVGYVQIRVPLPAPEYEEREPGDADRNVDYFERTNG